MWYLGLDWGEKYLDYCLENQSGDVVCRGRVDNDEQGFSKLLTQLFQVESKPSEIAVSIESPHQHVVEFLISRGISVYPVNPRAIHKYRQSCSLAGSKSDAADAQLIANFLRQHINQLKAWHLPEPTLRQLQILLSDRDKLIVEKVRLHNQLRSALMSYYPQALSIFSNLTCKTSLAFLSVFPTFGLACEKDESFWDDFLSSHRVNNPATREKFKVALNQPTIFIDQAVIEAKALLMQTLVSQLQSLIAAIAVYDQKIKQLLDEEDDGSRLMSLPGVDVILAAKLLVSLGTDRQRFKSVNELQSFFGTAPYTKQSGEYRSVHFRRACHKPMRTVLHQMALSSLRSSPWAKAYYRRKRKEGKRVYHALRCLANQWLKVIFAMWKNQTAYDQDKHLAAITRHQLAQSSSNS